MPYITWLDDIWTDHLAVRAQAAANAPLFREAFLRDALRVVPGKVATIDALARHYRSFSMTPMDLVMIAYGRRIAPQRQEWAALAGDETAAKPDEPASWSEQDEAAYQAAAEKFKQNQFLEAEVDLRNLLIRHPANVRLLKDLGTVYLQSSDWPMAAALYAYAHDLYPDDQNIANDLAVCLVQIDRVDLVPPILEAMLQARPDDLYLIRNISVYARQAGDMEKAVEFTGRWVALDPDNEDAKAQMRALLGADRDAGEKSP